MAAMGQTRERRLSVWRPLTVRAYFDAVDWLIDVVRSEKVKAAVDCTERAELA